MAHTAPATASGGGPAELAELKELQDQPYSHAADHALRSVVGSAAGSSYSRRVTDEDTAEFVIDRLLLALAAQLDASRDPILSAGAVEALADMSRTEAEVVLGQAGHLVHYGADTERLEALISAISAVLRNEAPGDAPFRPGDEVRLVGELPECLSEYDETWLRETVFVVRYVGRGPMIDVQSDLTQDYMIATVPASIVAPARR